MADKQQPRPVTRFELKLGGNETAGVFRECSGMSSKTAVATHKCVDGKGQPYVRKVALGHEWDDIVLKRGVDSDSTLWQWRQKVIREGPDAARVDGTISLLDYDGTPILTYKFLQGFPIMYGGVKLDAASGDIAIEEIHICIEDLERE
jgi:phage tail-like protein